MSALGRVVRSGVSRRKVQTIVIGLTATMAVTASILGGSVLVASSAPFENSFAAQRGAHLSAQFDGTKTTEASVSATGEVTGVTAASGPFPTVSVTPSIEPDDPPPGASQTLELAPMTFVGRADPGGSVDKVDLTEGAWPSKPGEVVVSADTDSYPLDVGDVLTFPDLTGNPTLTVVGKARSVSRTADAWVVPSEISTIAADDTDISYQMLYRFADAGTAAEVAAARDAVTDELPDGSLLGSQSWLAIRELATRDSALFVPFLMAFGALGLGMSILIIGNVITGAVTSGTRRIGVLKAVGFTPRQVTRAYVAQAVVPAAVGIAAGLVVGNLLAQPVLSKAASVYRSASLVVQPWVNVSVAVGALLVVAVTASVAARRAGRLRTVDALAVGRTPARGRGLRVGAWAARLPLPRAISLGLARPFARPARAMATVAAVAFGATAVTFAVGLNASLAEVLRVTANEAADVGAYPAGPQRLQEGGPEPGMAEPPGGSTAPTDHAAVWSAIGDQAGTEAYYAEYRTEATAVGASGQVSVEAFRGDASWGGYEMISGRWFDGSGEAVAPTPFLTATGTDVGDTVSLIIGGERVAVTIVGEVFDTTDGGMEIFTDIDTVSSSVPELEPVIYHIDVSDDADVAGYVTDLNESLEPLGASAQAGGTDQQSDFNDIANALSTLLTLMLVIVAALGVLNSVVLDTRERVQELGIHKSLGMVPRQTIAMVITSVVVPGLVGAAIGVATGFGLHRLVVPATGGNAGLTLPDVVVDVFGAGLVALLAIGGVAIAVIGSLLPAGWAARVRATTALRTE